MADAVPAQTDRIHAVEESRDDRLGRGSGLRLDFARYPEHLQQKWLCGVGGHPKEIVGAKDALEDQGLKKRVWRSCLALRADHGQTDDGVGMPEGELERRRASIWDCNDCYSLNAQ